MWNRIPGVFTNDGTWSTTWNDIQHQFLNYFVSLYSERNYGVPSAVSSIPLKELPSHESDLLQLDPTLEDIKQTLFSMKPETALGPDGIPPLFLQKMWTMTQADIVDLIKNIFNSNQIPQGLNDTVISLIPKKDNPSMPEHYRPISLCNVSFKILTKVIANRVKVILPLHISDQQVAFVPGRVGLDNIILVHEVINSFKFTSGKVGYFMAKLDIAKAYDTIRWSFIKDMLYRFKFSESIINLIMSCITSVSFYLNLNGQRSRLFKPKRGIRQGCPLSPYLYILCAEALSTIIKVFVDNGQLKGMKLGRNGLHITHLMFADDIVFIGQANKEQIRS